MDTTNKTPGKPPVWPPTTDGFVEMKLLVIAATGNLGKAIVNAALRDGHDVSVLPRTVNGTGHTDPSEFCATSI